jgi:predicted acetylornithine/succinylornithine family transaminase
MTLSSAQTLELADKCLLKNVSRLPLVLAKGKGTKVWDQDGREYYDFVAGIATCAFGHAPDFMAQVLESQAQKLIHVSNLYYTEPLVLLADILTKAAGLERAFFCNSGAEANEAALKMARKHGIDNSGPKRHVLISANNSFHGRTMGAISATGQAKLHEGFQPLLPGIRFVPYGDLPAMEKAIDDTAAGVILEPIQGEGGIVEPPEGYLSQVKKLCRDRGALLILDEIQTGLGRTGKDFAFRHFDVQPDIMTLGKALGCGYPVGAMLSSEEASKALGPGSHSTTVGGAPLAMALSLELVKRILEPDFLSQTQKSGQYLYQKLQKITQDHPDKVLGPRGKGLLLGLALKLPAAPISDKMRQLGFLVNATAGTVIRLVPPLTVSFQEIDLLGEALGQALASSPAESR